MKDEYDADYEGYEADGVTELTRQVYPAQTGNRTSSGQKSGDGDGGDDNE